MNHGSPSHVSMVGKNFNEQLISLLPLSRIYIIIVDIAHEEGWTKLFRILLKKKNLTNLTLTDADAGKKWTSSKFPDFPILSPIFH